MERYFETLSRIAYRDDAWPEHTVVLLDDADPRVAELMEEHEIVATERTDRALRPSFTHR